MAFWAKWMFWATVGSLAVSLAAIIFAFLSFRESRKSANDARKASQDSRQVGEFQTQAYVYAASARFGEGGNILIACKNGGSTPATHFSVNAIAQIVPRGRVTASISFRNDKFKIWSALGAGDELTVSVLEGDKDVRQFADLPGDNELLLVSGQIVYCTIFNHDHLTQFAFYVDAKTRQKFRRPTSNLVTFWRIPKAGMPPPRPPQTIRLDENEDVNQQSA
jgi:hypothetical protein